MDRFYLWFDSYNDLVPAGWPGSLSPHLPLPPPHGLLPDNAGCWVRSCAGVQLQLCSGFCSQDGWVWRGPGHILYHIRSVDSGIRSGELPWPFSGRDFVRSGWFSLNCSLIFMLMFMFQIGFRWGTVSVIVLSGLMTTFNIWARWRDGRGRLFNNKMYQELLT